MSTSIDSFDALDEAFLPRYVASADIESPPIRPLSIQSNARQTFTLSGWRTPVHTIQPRYNETFKAEVRLGLVQHRGHLVLLCAAADAHGQDAVYQLVLLLKEHNPVNWMASLQSTDQLKRITILSGHESEAILGAMKRPVNGISGNLSLLWLR